MTKQKGKQEAIRWAIARVLPGFLDSTSRKHLAFQNYSKLADLEQRSTD